MATVPDAPRPLHLDLDRARGLTVHWSDGRRSFYPLLHLRRQSPSADARELRKQMQKNPLTVLPSGGGSGELTALGAELVGNYAVRIRFSDGHETGLYSWEYLRSIDPDAEAAR
ncbi:MAG: DUF971 domain-containing protein [Phycisphaerales bacterium]